MTQNCKFQKIMTWVRKRWFVIVQSQQIPSGQATPQKDTVVTLPFVFEQNKFSLTLPFTKVPAFKFSDAQAPNLPSFRATVQRRFSPLEGTKQIHNRAQR